MLTQLEKSKQQWGGQNKTIDNWLQERQDLLVAYCQLIGLQPKETVDLALPTFDDIKRFNQILMDYISAGHFEIFNNISQQCDEKGPTDREKAQRILPKINNSTDLALQFNDKFGELDNHTDTSDFDIKIAELGRALEERFNYEDQLLAMLHRY